MNYSELQKLFPDFKIPYDQEADYYINLLAQSNPHLLTQLEAFQEYEAAIGGSLKKYKLDKVDEIAGFLKNNYNLNEVYPYSELEYPGQEFGNWRKDKIYVSIDLRSANWTSYKYLIDIDRGKPTLPSEWIYFLNSYFDIHPLLTHNKCFRQLVLGNTNPKKIAQGQKIIMSKIYKLVPVDLKQYLVATRPDELLFELPDWHTYHYAPFFESFNRHPELEKFQFRTDFYQVKEFKEQSGDFVRVREILNKKGEITQKELIGVPGNRFFVHYKPLILHQELEERDLYFKTDKHLAKWVI